MHARVLIRLQSRSLRLSPLGLLTKQSFNSQRRSRHVAAAVARPPALSSDSHHARRIVFLGTPEVRRIHEAARAANSAQIRQPCVSVTQVAACTLQQLHAAAAAAGTFEVSHANSGARVGMTLTYLDHGTAVLGPSGASVMIGQDAHSLSWQPVLALTITAAQPGSALWAGDGGRDTAGSASWTRQQAHSGAVACGGGCSRVGLA